MLKRLPLYEAFERIVVMFEMNTKPDAYLQRFADVLLEFSSKQPVGIADFLEWWEENQFRESCSVITPSGMDSIHIMTIHKSKGLQFPVVIMPYVSWVAQSDQKSSIWVHSDVDPFNQKPAHIVKVKSTLGQSFFSKDYQQEIMVSRLDNMNLLYVAFTRAEEQLHVFCKNFKANQKPDDKKWSAQVSRIINRILKKEQEWSDLLDQDGGFNLEWGTMSGPIKKQKSAGVVPESLREWISEPWQQRIRMLINKNRISSQDKQLPDPTYGIHFHAIAAMADGTKDADTLVMEYCLLQPVDHDHQLRLKNEIGLLIHTARIKGWFDDQAETRNETELLLENGKILRPDRLILKNSKAIVVDYKTGDEDSAHEKQVREYGSVLSRMGYTQTELYLFYPHLSKTLQVAS
jgi:ATP-dependent exoDNAse (exonuclease V) beta subunit